MAFETHEPSLLGVNFEVDTLSDTPDNILDATKRGAAWVWSKTTDGTPATIKIAFANRIVDKDGEPLNASGVYNPDNDFFAVALDKIKEGTDEMPGLDEQRAALVGGHEATHRVQFVHRGERPRPSEELIAEGIYEDDPHELEAWDESLQAFALLYLHVKAGFQVGIRMHYTPRSSRYDTRYTSRLSEPPTPRHLSNSREGIIPMKNRLIKPHEEQIIFRGNDVLRSSKT